jgi:hypothetical protein
VYYNSNSLNTFTEGMPDFESLIFSFIEENEMILQPHFNNEVIKVEFIFSCLLFSGDLSPSLHLELLFSPSLPSYFSLSFFLIHDQ